ncbi:response regulator [Leptolyngbya sp. AN10]|uniref:response regulator n=1 Tax=Leptolyngbya sp. AN10 TaxID=3423365 RepID=UPI003D30F94D
MIVQTLRPITILLVEDALSDAHLIVREFQRSSFETELHWVETGEAAMQFLHQQGNHRNAKRPDLILLDLNLPGLNGQEVLEQVKQHPDLKQIPIVILSTSPDPQDIRQSYSLNANTYVTKPVEVHQFVQVVQQIIEFWLAAASLPVH